MTSPSTMPRPNGSRAPAWAATGRSRTARSRCGTTWSTTAPTDAASTGACSSPCSGGRRCSPATSSTIRRSGMGRTSVSPSSCCCKAPGCASSTGRSTLYTQRQGAISGRASGLTRTTIAYHDLSVAAIEMSRDPRLASDPELVALLRIRARGLASPRRGRLHLQGDPLAGRSDRSWREACAIRVSCPGCCGRSRRRCAGGCGRPSQAH